jgi:acyl carrier protein
VLSLAANERHSRLHENSIHLEQEKENRRMETSIQTKTRAFLTTFFQNIEITGDQDIFALGFINSLFAMQLVLFVEKEFDLKIEDEDLDIDNFRSLNAIAALVERNLTPITQH